MQGCLITLLVIGLLGVIGAITGPPAASPAKSFTENHQYTLMALCREAVRGHLKAPSTATFSNEIMGKTKDGEKYGIVGYVDSQNAFGAMLRDSFGCRFSEAEQVEALSIGDQQWGDFSYGHEPRKQSPATSVLSENLDPPHILCRTFVQRYKASSCKVDKKQRSIQVKMDVGQAIDEEHIFKKNEVPPTVLAAQQFCFKVSEGTRSHFHGYRLNITNEYNMTVSCSLPK